MLSTNSIKFIRLKNHYCYTNSYNRANPKRLKQLYTELLVSTVSLTPSRVHSVVYGPSFASLPPVSNHKKTSWHSDRILLKSQRPLAPPVRFAGIYSNMIFPCAVSDMFKRVVSGQIRPLRTRSEIQTGTVIVFSINFKGLSRILSENETSALLVIGS